MSARRLPPGAGASLALFVLFLAAWEWGPGLLGIPTYIIPSLSEVAREAVRMWQVSHVLMHTGVTAGEVLAGFALGSLLGAFIGYVLGMSPATEVALSPYILALQIAPKVAFAPLFILWMGYSVYPKILVAVLIVFFPVMVNVLTAIRTVDPDLIKQLLAEMGLRRLFNHLLLQTGGDVEEAMRWMRALQERGLIDENVDLDAFFAKLTEENVIGEDRNAQLLYLALVSRLLDTPVSIAVKGPSSGGKSFTVESALAFFPDDAYYALSDALQYLGNIAFRAPVPAYKHSAAAFLHITKRISTGRTHPQSPTRPPWELEMMQDCIRRLGL